MEHQPTAITTFNEPTIAPKLPTFLNVLTILTIIASVYGIISGSINYALKNKAEAIFANSDSTMKMITAKDTAQKNVKLNNALEKMLDGAKALTMQQYKYINQITAAIIICAGLCITGAILMRKRKKTGFFIYLIGELGIPILYFVIFSGIVGGAFLIAWETIIAIPFIFMYALQIKELNR